ncbi:DUF4349 domain-containing protein [Virgibacillus sp. C22-A2]|uniref:DUF4349 domain-containing protein n=1 Tax=Virgibacillus tibetensis TaxID=3042313 RepID=A0ABU6KMG7_9BACI|nr:DUF4349 domain-containing protein [Virgibacillus sp. C22-A2]
MKKILLLIMTVCISVLVTACSNDDTAENSETGNDDASYYLEESESSSDLATGSSGESAGSDQDSATESETSNNMDASELDRKIIYTGNLHIEVKDYQKAIDEIQAHIADRGGYVVESTMHEGAEKGSTNGQITARIPQDQFQDFIRVVEEGSGKVLESSVSGQDVTEEYVDLESRLKSKKVVEDRLLSFMENAEKTEDLLTISSDLEKVQGDIEEVTGRMNYLQNKADLATVTIYIQENNVTISGINEDDLNTWEKTKQQFLKSINTLLSAFSSLVVFFIGNLPVLLIIGFIGFVTFLVIRKRIKSNENNN